MLRGEGQGNNTDDTFQAGTVNIGHDSRLYRYDDKQRYIPGVESHCVPLLKDIFFAAKTRRREEKIF